jgi:hypothetical protein
MGLSEILKKYFNPVNFKADSPFFDKLSLLLITLVTLLLLSVSVGKPELHYGEGDDFALAAITVVKRLNTIITPEDIEQSREEFPEIYPSIRRAWESANLFISTREGNPNLFVNQKNEILSFYFPTFSVLCLPAIHFLKAARVFGPTLSMSYGFTITAVLIFTLSLIFVYRFLKIDSSQRFILILLLALSPVIKYNVYITYELALFGFLVCAFTCVYNKWYYAAGLLVSIAATMNTAALGFGILVAGSWFYDKLWTQGLSVKTIKENAAGIIKLAAAFLPFLLNLLYMQYYYGTLVPQGSLAKMTGLFGRFSAYLFDLNFGILPYYPLLLPIFFIALAYCAYKKNIYACFLGISFLTAVLMYSVTSHINCGVVGAHRYVSWSVSALIFMIAVYFINILKKTKKIAACVGVVSAFLSFAVIIINDSVEYVYWLPIPKAVLNNYPALYNPYPYTFISKNIHVDGGYLDYSEKPYLYIDENNAEIRKILVNRHSAKILSEMAEKGRFIANPSDMAALKGKISALKFSGDKPKYINISKEVSIKEAPFLIKGQVYRFNNAEAFKFLGNGWDRAQSKAVWSQEQNVEIIFHVEPETSQIKLVFNALITQNHPQQRIAAMVNGTQLPMMTYSNPYNNLMAIEVPDELKDSGGVVKINLFLFDAVSPAELGLGASRIPIAIYLIGAVAE